MTSLPQSPDDPPSGAFPPDPAFHLALAATRRGDGDELGALAHLIAAQTLQASTDGGLPAAPSALLDVATGYFMKGEYATAQRWYELVLRLDANLAVAHQNLAAIHAQRGDHAAAAASRAHAYRIQRVFVEPVAEPTRRLLILCSARSAGNVPFESLLAGGTSLRIKYAIDCAPPDEDALLPPFDLVFNAVGEPDVDAALAERLERFAVHCPRPLLNRPAAVQATRRDRLATLLGDIEGVVLAPCVRCEQPPETRPALLVELDRAGLAHPLLVRPVASHGGFGLLRCDTLELLEAALRGIGGACYLTGFLDTRSPDEHFRKYRIVFVGGVPWPYHLAISSQWMVHYFSADMAGQQWKLDEERRFLDDPETVLGATATKAIAAIGRRLGLDYAGVDFTLLPDGRVFVFEANATMLVHRERPDGPLAYRNASVQRIIDAFERRLTDCAAHPVLAHDTGQSNK